MYSFSQRATKSTGRKIKNLKKEERCVKMKNAGRENL